ncbi:MAG: transcription elongation protein SprT [Alphaproteobacteria bacterium]|nr:transcription elongation protein SprT [Alphaproteobacteria bacterium]
MRLEPRFRELGFELPGIRVTCGFPSGRALNGSKSQTIGQCWPGHASKDGTVEVMVSPVRDEPMKVLGILAHELVHAAVGCEHGHKGPFQKLAKAIGLTGRMTATEEGPDFVKLAEPIIAELGEYPHAALNASARKKQGTRMLKAECDGEGEGCGYTVRITRKWVDEVGPPLCPIHGEMKVYE